MKKIIFWGTPVFSVPALKSLYELGMIAGVTTQPDSRGGRGHTQVLRSAVKISALSLGLPIIQTEKFDAEFTAKLKKLLPATFLVVAYGKLIPDRILELSELPAINIHPSLLPDLRGPSPIQTALLRGHTQTGITLMQLDAEMDHGPVLAQKKISIAPEDTAASLTDKLSFASAQFVAKLIPAYLAGDLRPVVQDHHRATTTSLLKASDGLLDQGLSAQVLFNKIRAFTPWPGTHILWRGKRLKIIQARFLSDRPAMKFSKSSTGTLVLACDSGALEILTIQPENKKPMSSIDFLNGYPDLLRSRV